MRGLMYKDLINLKQQAVIYAIMIGVYSIMVFWGSSASLLGGVVCLLSTILPINAMAYDEKTNWDKYAITLPVKRSTVVLSRYFLGIGFSLIGAALTFCFALIDATPMMEKIVTVGALWMICVIYLSILLPILFKMGSEKSRLLMIVVLLLPMFLIGAGTAMLESSSPGVLDQISAFITEWASLLPIIAVVVTLLILLLSVAISLRIYSKKEF